MNSNFDSLACAFKTQYLHKKINRAPIMHSNQKWETQSLHKKITRVHVPFMYSNQKWETSRDGDETFFLTSVILNKNKENEKH